MLFKEELIRNPPAPARGRTSTTSIAVAEYIDWFDHRRLHGAIGLIPPVEHETHHYATLTKSSSRAWNPM